MIVATSGANQETVLISKAHFALKDCIIRFQYGMTISENILREHKQTLESVRQELIKRGVFENG
jgi:hypothetical protein